MRERYDEVEEKVARGGGYGNGKTVLFSDPETRVGLSLALEYALFAAGKGHHVHWVTHSSRSPAPFGPALPFAGSVLDPHARAAEKVVEMGGGAEKVVEMEIEGEEGEGGEVDVEEVLERVGMVYVSGLEDVCAYAARIHQCHDKSVFPAVIVVDGLMDLHARDAPPPPPPPSSSSSTSSSSTTTSSSSSASAGASRVGGRLVGLSNVVKGGERNTGRGTHMTLAQAMGLLADAADHCGSVLYGKESGMSADVLLVESLTSAARVSPSRTYTLPAQLPLLQHWIGTTAVAAGSPSSPPFVFSVLDVASEPDPFNLEIEFQFQHTAIGIHSNEEEGEGEGGSTGREEAGAQYQSPVLALLSITSSALSPSLTS